MKTQVIIIGAGPTGLLLGCLLLQQNVDCILIEKTASLSQETKALMVHARSLEILHTLNLTEKLLQRGIRAKYLSFYIDNKKTFRFSFEDLNTCYPFYLIIPQPEVEKILHEKFLSLGGSIHRNRKFVSLNQSSYVSSLIENNGKLELYCSEYLVGCDGASSTVRTFLDVPFNGITYDIDYILAEGNLKSDLRHDEASMYITSKGILSVLPLPNNKFRVAGPAIGKKFLSKGEELSIETFKIILKKTELSDILSMRQFDRVKNYTVNERIVPSFKIGRVFLAGDAAHIHSPAGGQAMNVGFQDTYNLANKLAGVMKDKKSCETLDRYHLERYPIAIEAIRTANFFEFINEMKTAENIDDFQDIYSKGAQLVRKLSQLDNDQIRYIN